MIEQQSNNDPLLVEEPITLRSYQLEMFERSLGRNSIVVMETGSGKTLVALFRIKHAVEEGDGTKLVWFLAGSRPLCRQQFEYVSVRYKAANCKLILGDDGPEFWGSKSIWDEVLSGVNVMFSTFQILADAISHAYVRLEDIQLLIFDEAHHVKRGHPSNDIMKFYRDKRDAGVTDLPCILGLTASPSEDGQEKSLRQLEFNLCSTYCTPRKHRSELQQHVHQPILSTLAYRGQERAEEKLTWSFAASLPIPTECFGDIDTVEIANTLERVKQKVNHLIREIGFLAADIFIEDLTAALGRKIANSSSGYCWNSTRKELFIQRHLELFSTEIKAAHDLAKFNSGAEVHLTDKARRLFEYITSLFDDRGDSFLGIVFVEQRVVAAMLGRILSGDSQAIEGVTSGVFVGESNTTPYKRELSELVIPSDQRSVLQRYRDGEVNLILSTDALDEGIDVTACNTIICFDKPKNLRSFTQKRGRSRQPGSTFTIMVPDSSMKSLLKEFESLSRLMARMVEEENHRVQIAQRLEAVPEHVPFRLVSNIGATLTAIQTREHLKHYCAKLPKHPYTSYQPAFHCLSGPDGLLVAEFRLPMQIPSAVRVATSSRPWKTEHAAVLDAAFQAYKGLYEHGHLTENLLPKLEEPSIDDDLKEQSRTFHQFSKQLSPWKAEIDPSLEKPWLRTAITIHERSRGWTGEQLTLWSRTDLSMINDFELLGQHDEAFEICVGASIPAGHVASELQDVLAACTKTLVGSFRSSPVPAEILPAVYITPALDLDSLATWIQKNEGHIPISELEACRTTTSWLGLYNESLHVCRNFQYVGDDEGGKIFDIECVPFPQRRNFLPTRQNYNTPVDIADESEIDDLIITAQKQITVPAEECTFLRLQPEFAWTMRFVPSVFYRLEMALVEQTLSKEVFAGFHFRSTRELSKAFVSPKTGLRENYDRLEFIGDTVLKFQATKRVLCQHPYWHEGLLTRKRNTLVGNIILAKASVRNDLDQYIRKDPFSGKKWMPPTKSSILQQENLPRSLPQKDLADVVEAVIGAAFLGGGQQEALAMMSSLLAGFEEQQDLSLLLRPDSDSEGLTTGCSSWISRTSSLVGYSFRHEYLLLEALTHPSCTRDITREPYQRLEFLGDAVLDMIVVDLLYNLLPKASASKLTTIKAALVNTDFLAFLCYSCSTVTQEVTYSQRREGEPPIQHSQEHELRLVDMMRYDAEAVFLAAKAGLEGFQSLQHRIHDQLGQHEYPWLDLCLMRTPKFAADIVESVLGALFLDSGGDLAPCHAFLDRLGLIDFLKSIAQHVDVTHPQERLNRLLCGRKLHHTHDHNAMRPNDHDAMRPNDHDAMRPNDHDWKIHVNERLIAHVEACNSKNEAKMRAVDLACKKLSQEGFEDTVK